MMEEILAKARKKASHAELFFEESDTLLARSSLDRIEACKQASDSGYGLRVVHKGKVGFSYFQRPGDADRAIREAIHSAKLSHGEKYSLPTPSRHQGRKTFDKRVASITEEKLVDLLLASMDAAPPAEPMKSEVEAASSTTRIMSTEGIDLEARDTLFTIYSIAKKEESFGEEFYTSKRFSNRASEVGMSAGEWAVRGKGGKPISYTGVVTLDQDVIASFFQTAVLQNTNGEFARRGKSRWKLGDFVGGFSLIDDPSVDWGVGTASFDDEGIPTKKCHIIRTGRLKQFYYDTRTANLAGTSSTGSGFRDGYSSVPSISASNVIIKPREAHSSPAGGMYVKELMGYHNMNPVSGDFSLDISLAILGDRPVRGCVLTGNIFDILKNGEWGRRAKTRGWLTSPVLSFEGEVVAK